MMKSKKIIAIFAFLINSSISICQPFQTIGGAYNVPTIPNINCVDAEACFTLTENTNWQQGAVWDLDTIDLNLAFDATFCMFIGANDGGADGFSFLLRDPNSNTYGEEGGALGYGTANGTQGIFPSIAIEFDSFFNNEYFDIQEDHTQLVINANVTNPPAVPAISLLPNNSNIEDNNFHNSRIVWDPVTQNLSMYFDGNLRFTFNQDIINTVFNGNSQVIWGFTASTGGMTNLHQICFPKLMIELPDQIVCYNDSALVNYFHENLTEYYWNSPSDDSLLYWNNTLGFPLTDTSFFANENGVYELHVEFNNKNYESTFNLTYDNSLPISLGIDSSFCQGQNMLLKDVNNSIWNTYLWENGSTSATKQVSTAGLYWCEVSNIPQCKYRDSVVISILPTPTLDLLPFDSSACVPGNFILDAIPNQLNSNLTWTFSDGTTFLNQNQVNYINDSVGDYSFQITIISADNCTNSYNFANVIHVLENPTALFSYEISEISSGYSVQLTNESLNYSNLDWLINQTEQSTIENPIFFPTENSNIVQLIAFNGLCSDTIIKTIELDNIEVIVPNIITNPGGETTNSILNLFSDNFKNFNVTILNRWGISVSEGTKNAEKPLYLWNGIDLQTQKKCTDGVYFILLSGELKNGKPYEYQGFVTIAGN